MNWRAKLLSFLHVRPDERHLVGLALCFTLLLNAASVLTKSAAYALFLQDFSGSDLPYTYIGISLFTPLATLAYLKLNERTSLDQAAKVGVAIIFIVSIAYRWALESAFLRTAAIFTLPIIVGIMTSLGMIIFWNLLGRLFTLQQGKRLFGLLNSGEQIALLVSGLFVPVLVIWIGTPNLLLVAAGLLAASWFLLAILGRDYHDRLSINDDTGDRSSSAQARIPRDRYIALIFSLYIAYMIGAYFVNNLFFSQAQSQITDEAALASFVGLFTALTGGMSLIIQLFIAPQLLSRRGIGVFLLLTPFAVIFFMTPYTIFSAVSGTTPLLFIFVGLAHLFRIVFDAADTAAFNVLYQTIPALVRTRVQTFNDGIFYPISIGVAGVLLLLLLDAFGWSETQLALVLLGICVIWLWLARSLGREYPRQVQLALRKRIFSEQESIILEPENTAEIERMLQDENPRSVLYALDLLEDARADRLPDYLASLLSHSSPVVRAESAQRIDRSALHDLIPAVTARIEIESNPLVCAALHRTIAHQSDPAAAEALLETIDLAEPVIQQQTFIGLLNRYDEAGQKTAMAIIEGWATSDNAMFRMQAATVAGELRNSLGRILLIKLLDDPDADVRNVALQSAGALGELSLGPHVLRQLNSPENAAVAADALVAIGPQVAPLLFEAVADRQTTSKALQIRLIKIIGRIGGNESREYLYRLLPHEDFDIQAQLLRSLCRCGFRLSYTDQLEVDIQPDIRRTAWLLTAWAELTHQSFPGQSDEAVDLLETAFEQALKVQRQNIFYWLSFAYEKQLMNQVQFNLAFSADSRTEREQIAYAGEIIELHVGYPVRNWIKPVISLESVDSRVESLIPLFRPPDVEWLERLAIIITEDEPCLSTWIRACSIYLAGFLKIPQLLTAIQAAARSGDPLLAETASQALMRLDNNKAVPGHHFPDNYQTQSKEIGVNPMLRTIEKVLLLKSVELFTGTSDSILAQLADLMDEVNVAAGEPIIRKGEVGDSMYVVAQGFFQIHTDDVTLAWVWESEVIGELALLDDAPRSASVTAVTDSLLLRLDRAAFNELLEDHPEVSRRILQLMAQRLRIANAKLKALDAGPAQS